MKTGRCVRLRSPCRWTGRLDLLALREDVAKEVERKASVRTGIRALWNAVIHPQYVLACKRLVLRASPKRR
jgi:hypothetical protein